MKEFTYLIPPKYMPEPPKKPIAVKAWETSVKGLIVQRPIGPAGARVHLTHKASGTALVFLVAKKKAFEIAKKLKKLPIDFTCYSPGGLYRQLAKLNDRQVDAFRTAVGHKGPMISGLWRSYCQKVAENFERMFGKGKGSKPAKPARRSKGGKTWKARK